LPRDPRLAALQPVVERRFLMSPPWFSRSRRARKDAAHKRLADAAYLRGVEDGKAQGWQECEVHYRPLLLELQREKAVLETRRQLAFSEGVQAGQAMALYEDPAWARKAARRAS